MNNVIFERIRSRRKRLNDKHLAQASLQENRMLTERIRRLGGELTRERTMRQMWQERYYALAKITREVIEEHERSIIDTDAWENENENHAG